MAEIEESKSGGGDRYRKSFASANAGEMADDCNSMMNWSVELEVGLFHAVHEHKPVGINRHFKMLFIHDKLNSTIKNKILVQDIWKHLGTLYDMQALNDSEGLPFPNAEAEFALPDEFLDDLKDKPFPRLPRSASTEEPRRASSDSGVEPATNSDAAADSKLSGHGNAFKNDKTTLNDNIADKLYSQKACDSPARSEQRKRTRQSLNPPSTANPPTASAGQSTPSAAETTATSSAKRSRRI